MHNSLHAQVRNQTLNPHCRGNHQDKIRVSALLFGFSISICCFNQATCCNALCPKGLSVCAVSVKMWGAWWHTFKPGQAGAANSSYSSIKSLQAHTCCEVNLSPLAVGQHRARRCHWGVVQGLSKARCASCVLLGKSVLDSRREELSHSGVWQHLDSSAAMMQDLVWGTSDRVVPV